MSPTFASLGLPERMVNSLAQRGITDPFPIQAATLPDALAGRDICGRAPTGSGKTLAFGIPLVLGVQRARPRRPRALVLVPTRELAAQVCHELQLLAKPKGPWVEPFYGGVGFQKQLAGLKRGVDIAVACPGRLADLINQEQMSLRDVEFVVIDEADRMADMGFLPEVKRLLDQCSSDRQTLLFSATLDGDVDVLIKRYQTNPARHEEAGDEDDASRATHLFWGVERNDRLATTAKIVADHGPTVVFCRTKRGADRVARQLESAGVTAAAIHGDRSQAQRERALRSFHHGQVDALVATDVAARGIHVDGVECVVHFDLPPDPKDYVHRSGRTARAGASGVVVSLVTPDLRGEAKKLQKALGYPIGITKAFDSVDHQPRERAERPERVAPERVTPERPAERRTRDDHRQSRSNRDGVRPATKPKRKPRPRPDQRDGGASNESGDSTGESRPSGPRKRHVHVHEGPRVRTKKKPNARKPGAKASSGPGSRSNGPQGGAPGGAKKRSGPKNRAAGNRPDNRRGAPTR